MIKGKLYKTDDTIEDVNIQYDHELNYLVRGNAVHEQHGNIHILLNHDPRGLAHNKAISDMVNDYICGNVVVFNPEEST